MMGYSGILGLLVIHRQIIFKFKFFFIMNLDGNEVYYSINGKDYIGTPESTLLFVLFDNDVQNPIE